VTDRLLAFVRIGFALLVAAGISLRAAQPLTQP
jgi:hypothetical protein